MLAFDTPLACFVDALDIRPWDISHSSLAATAALSSGAGLSLSDLSSFLGPPHTSVVLAFLFRLAWVFTPGLPESDLGSIVGFLTVGTLKMSLLINMVLAPLSFVVGLVYSTFRHAMRQGVESALSSDS